METLIQGNLSVLTILAVILPLASFLWIILVPGKSSRGAALATSSISLSFFISALLFILVWNNKAVHEQVSWFTIGSTSFKVGFYLNNLSVLMMVLISAIAVLVHIYSTRYMHGDAYLYRYWAYLSLFCFSMMGLVVTDNLLILYMFWELVGFSSYLLIGFWFTKEAAAKASKKAFIMNRLGDLGFLTGIMILYSQFRTLDIVTLFEHGGLVFRALVQNGLWIAADHQMPDIWLTIAGLAFFFGATAKSAQFPLHTWLPDAMEGPTSVSSLIHAATMVAAGVFLLARIFPIFTEDVLTVVASIGAFTALMAGLIAVTQNDIKRILAFSTISQLGFMMMAMGVGAHGAALFHLVTHAFFKCLLFLAAGAVIHELAHMKEKVQSDFDHQDIRNMGGLSRKMPVTFVTMLLAGLALAGLPFSSGFLSKDAILIAVFEWADNGNFFLKMIPYSAVLTSALTAFYISRLLFKVFLGKFRLAERVSLVHIHEAPAAMKYVLVVLALFCVFLPFSLNPFNYHDAWIFNGLGQMEMASGAYHLWVPIIVGTSAAVSILVAYRWYVLRNAAPDFSSTWLFRFAQHQWYLNEIYHAVFVSGVSLAARLANQFDRRVLDGLVQLSANVGVLAAAILHWFDKSIVDGLIDSFASAAKTIGNLARNFQTGRLQHYLLTMVLVVLTLFIIKFFSLAI